MKRISVRMEDDLHFRLREYSFKTNISMNDTLIEALTERLDKFEKEEKKKEMDGDSDGK